MAVRDVALFVISSYVLFFSFLYSLGRGSVSTASVNDVGFTWHSILSFDCFTFYKELNIQQSSPSLPA